MRGGKTRETNTCKRRARTLLIVCSVFIHQCHKKSWDRTGFGYLQDGRKLTNNSHQSWTTKKDLKKDIVIRISKQHFFSCELKQ